MIKLAKTAAILSSAVILVLTGMPVYAHEDSNDNSDNRISQTDRATDTEKKGTDRAKEQQRLQESKDKVCRAKKDVAGSTQSRVIKRGQNRLDAFTKIAERAQQFKTNKNLNVDNYDALVSDVNTKKAAAQAAIDALSSDKGELPNVACGRGQGKPAIEKFKTDLKAEQNALKSYKNSIQTLIKAIKTAAKTTTTEGSQQ